MKSNEIAREFLLEFFDGDIEPGQTFALWVKHNRSHAWASSIDEACFMAEQKKTVDCYFSMGMFPEHTKKRTQDKVIAIHGVWLDIDVGDKQNGRAYFPTMEEAIEWVTNDLAGMWSIIVHSGGGLHVYLLFEEPLETKTLIQHTEARKLVKAFHSWAKSRCEFDLDPVIDLSRVMRLPGTMNTKAGQPCHVIEISGKRVNASELADLLPKVELDDSSQQAELGNVEEVDYPLIQKRIEMMCQVDDNFRRTWTRMRNFKDNSLSSYCMSLANLLCEAGFSNGEVFTALRTFRALHGGVQKPAEWFHTTIAKARQQTGGALVQERFDATITAAMEELAEVQESDPEVEVETKNLDSFFTEIFGLPLKRLVKVLTPDFHGISERPSYRLEFKNGKSVDIGGSGTLMAQQVMKQLLYDGLGVTMKTIKAQKYDDVLRIMATMTEEEHLALEANFGYTVASCIEALLDQKIESCEIIEDLGLFEIHLLFKDEDGVTWAHFDLISSKVAMLNGGKVEHKQLASTLKKLGSSPHRFGKKRLRLWNIPENLTAEI